VRVRVRVRVRVHVYCEQALYEDAFMVRNIFYPSKENIEKQ